MLKMNRRHVNRLSWKVLALAALATEVSCTDGDDNEPDAGAGRAGASGAAGSAAGTATQGGAGGSMASGGSSGSDGGDRGGQAGFEACEDEQYDLPSYDGDTQGLCPIVEHMWRRCCPASADIAAADEARCAPDGSACVISMFCTAFSPEYGRDFECGWHACESPGNEGGAAGSEPNCPRDELAVPVERPCASDVDCRDGLVCNQRFYNRMFCGEPGGGSGGQAGGGLPP